MKNVLVIFGGKSVEHDVSVITGVMTANVIDKQKYNVIPVLITADGEWVSGKELFDIDGYKSLDVKKLSKVTLTCASPILYKKKGKKLKEIASIYVAINCLHGGEGEDGSIAGLFNCCNIPLASPNVLSSAISMDKRFTKIVLKGLGVNVLPCDEVSSQTEAEMIKERLTYPVIVKPNLLGSSIGITKAKTPNELIESVNGALRYGERAIIEPCLDGFMEINCAAYKDQNGKIKVSECERPVGKSNILSFNDKYQGGKRIFPADVSQDVSEKIKRITKTVYKECGFNGVIRIDFFVKEDEVYLNEINAVPGSLAYYLFCDTLREFSVMVEGLIQKGVNDFAKKSTFNTSYKSNVLLGFGSKGAKNKNRQ